MLGFWFWVRIFYLENELILELEKRVWERAIFVCFLKNACNFAENSVLLENTSNFLIN